MPSLGKHGPVNMSVVQSGALKKPTLDNGQLTRIGAQMVKDQLARWAKHQNAYGNEAKPLSRRYLFIKNKIRKQSRSYRDNYLTGLLVSNFTLRKAINNQIRAENTSRKARDHAAGAQQYDEMIGFSGPEQVTIIKNAQAEYGQYLIRAWIKIA
jgi:hypothetical protein